MKSDENPKPSDKKQSGPPSARTAVRQLVVVPLAVYAVWMLETFLLEKNVNLFARIGPGELILYTVVACVLTGIILPFLILQKSFLSGDVNLFQIGFRSLSRTLTMGIGTILAGYIAVILFSPFGADQGAFAGAFLLLLPTAMASAMICWVLAGTHIQAYVRGGGSQVSIPAGVITTAMLFGITPLVHSNMGSYGIALSSSMGAGIIAAFFFFAVRDVYATTLVIAGMSAFLMAGRIDPVTLAHPAPAVYASAALATVVLIGIHWYLFRHYTTIQIPVLRGSPKDPE